MLALVLATLFSASFTLVIRHAQGKHCNLYAVGAINYATAATFHLTRHGLQGGTFSPSAPTLLLGMLGGVAFVSTYYVLFPLMKQRGVSISTAVGRLSAVMPLAASVLLWGEQPTTTQALGASIALASLPLLSIGRTPDGERPTRRGIFLLVALFIGNGLCALAIPAYHQTGVQGESSLFLGVLFGTAALVAGAVWLRQRRGTCWRDLAPGLMLGGCNALSNMALISALDSLPGFIVFPILSAFGLVLSAAFARLIWHERINRLETAGMTLAVVAVAFINL
ncbi:MAG: EamA family transporter [Anaerolineae bacterium]